MPNDKKEQKMAKYEIKREEGISIHELADFLDIGSEDFFGSDEEGFNACFHRKDGYCVDVQVVEMGKIVKIRSRIAPNGFTKDKCEIE